MGINTRDERRLVIRSSSLLQPATSSAIATLYRQLIVPKVMDAKLKTTLLFLLAGYLVQEFQAAPSPILDFGFSALLLKKGIIGAAIAKPLLLKKGVIGGGLIAKPLLVKKGLIGAGLVTKPLLIKKGLIGGGLVAKPVLVKKGLIGAGLVAKPLLVKKGLIAGGGAFAVKGLAAKKALAVPVVLGGKVIAGKVAFGKAKAGKIALVGKKLSVIKPVVIKKVALGKFALSPSVEVQGGKEVSVHHEIPSAQLELIESAPELYPVPEPFPEMYPVQEPFAIPGGPIEMVGPIPEMYPVQEPFAIPAGPIEMVEPIPEMYPVPEPVIEIGKNLEVGKALDVSL